MTSDCDLGVKTEHGRNMSRVEPSVRQYSRTFALEVSFRFSRQTSYFDDFGTASANELPLRMDAAN